MGATTVLLAGLEAAQALVLRLGDEGFHVSAADVNTFDRGQRTSISVHIAESPGTVVERFGLLYGGVLEDHTTIDDGQRFTVLVTAWQGFETRIFGAYAPATAAVTL